MTRRASSEGFAALKEKLAARPPARLEAEGALEASVALLLVPGAGGPEALFIRRAERADDPWSGHVALPGGRREPSDRDLLATAIRETSEEVGVALGPALLLGGLDDLRPRTPSLPPLLIRPYVFGLAARPKLRPNGEVAGVMWLALPGLVARAGRAVVSVRGAATEVDCFRLGDAVIWGLTYRILRGLLPLLAGTPPL
jgi:8-oxo-dGTP pyrophosphatase MutT (NUDIX family)